MQTFIKKLSRNSEFTVVISEEVKKQYGLVVDQVVSFEVARRDNGLVVLHKDATIASVDGDTEIVFSTNELSLRENINLEDLEIYDYRVVAYSSISDSEVSIVTQFFDKVQMLTDNIFGMGDTDVVRGNQLVLDYSGGVYRGIGYEYGTTQLKFDINRDENFIVNDSYLDSYDVTCEGFDPVKFAYWEGDTPEYFGFSLGDGSSNVVQYDSSADVFYIPSDCFYGSSGEPISPLNFKLIKGANWQYGVQFRYLEPSTVAALGQAAMGQMVDFSNAVVTNEYPEVIDYFEGINLERVDGVETGRCQTFGEIIEQYGSSSYEDDNFPFFSSDYYDLCDVDGLKVSGIIRDGSSLSFSGANGAFINSQQNIVSQIDFLNQSFYVPNVGWIMINPNDIMVLDVILKERKYTFSYALNFLNGDSPREGNGVDVYLTDWGKNHIEIYDDFEVGYFTSEIVSGIERGTAVPSIVSSGGKMCVGFSVNPYYATSSLIQYRDLTSFVENSDVNFFRFVDSGGDSPLSSYQIVYRSEYNQYLSDGKVKLYPVFLDAEPYMVSLTTSEAVQTNYSLEGSLFIGRRGNVNEGQIDLQKFNYGSNFDWENESSSSSGEDDSILYAYQCGVEGIIKCGNEYFTGATGRHELSFSSGGVMEVTGTGKAQVLVTGDIISVDFIQWGDWVYNADYAFANLASRASFGVPQWSYLITSARGTYSATNVAGYVPPWRNIVNADSTYAGAGGNGASIGGDSMVNPRMIGNIPPWEKVKSAMSTYTNCKYLTGIWDMSAPTNEIMPSDIAHDKFTVAGTGLGLRAYFTQEWGGVLDFGFGARFLIRVDSASSQSPFVLNINTTASGSALTNWIDWGDGTAFGTSGSHPYVNEGYYIVSIRLDQFFQGAVSVSVSGNGGIERILSLNPESYRQVCFVFSSDALQGIKRVYATLNVCPSEFANASELLQLEDLNGNCTSVGESAFENCTSLKRAYLPSCNTVGANAFKDCGHLAEIILGECSGFSDGCFIGVGDDLEADEDGIKARISINDTIANCKAHQDFAWDAPSSVLFLCSDGDIRCGKYGWDIIPDSLEIVNMPNDNAYTVVKDEVGSIPFKYEGLDIVVHYVDAQGNPLPEADEHLDYIHGLRVADVTAFTEDSVTAYYTYSGETVFVEIPVEATKIDIADVENRTLLGAEARLGTNEFTALSGFDARQEPEYRVLCPAENLQVRVTYDIVLNGESRQVIVDVSNRRGADGNKGVYITANAVSDVFRLKKYAPPPASSDGGTYYNSNYITLLPHTGGSMNYVTLKNKKSTSIQDGDSIETKYLLMKVKNEYNYSFMTCRFIDSGLNENVMLMYGSEIKVWMPFDIVDVSANKTNFGEVPDIIRLNTPFVIAFYPEQHSNYLRKYGASLFYDEAAASAELKKMKSLNYEIATLFNGSVYVLYFNYFFPGDTVEVDTGTTTAHLEYKFGLYYKYAGNWRSTVADDANVNELPISFLDGRNGGRLLSSWALVLQNYSDNLLASPKGIKVYENFNNIVGTDGVPSYIFEIKVEIAIGRFRDYVPVAVFVSQCFNNSSVVSNAFDSPYEIYVPGVTLLGNISAVADQSDIDMWYEPIDDDGDDPILTICLPYTSEYWNVLYGCHFEKNEAFPDGAYICKTGTLGAFSTNSELEPFILYDNSPSRWNMREVNVNTGISTLKPLENPIEIGSFSFTDWDELNQVLVKKDKVTGQISHMSCEELKEFYNRWGKSMINGRLIPQPTKCTYVDPPPSQPTQLWYYETSSGWEYGQKKCEWKYITMLCRRVIRLDTAPQTVPCGKMRVHSCSYPNEHRVSMGVFRDFPVGFNPGAGWKLINAKSISPTPGKKKVCNSISPNYSNSAEWKKIAVLCNWETNEVPRYKLF